MVEEPKMKFTDIPQFPRTSYRIEVSLRDVPHTLKRYQTRQTKAGYQFLLNPDFQRGHIWTEKQQQEYLEFILKGGMTGRDIYFNQSGWLDSYEGDMICVDGLQRLTAVTAFLGNDLKVFGHTISNFEDHLSSEYALIFNIAKLKTRAELLEWYIGFNTGGTTHSTLEIDRVRSLLSKEKTIEKSSNLPLPTEVDRLFSSWSKVRS